ncbi:hypothetical protein ACQUY5_26865 [Bacillus cereus]|uniref:hypothetical protein n=1 Tax=Bacillus cereus TaxID=1396 RepID=UPI003D172827
MEKVYLDKYYMRATEKVTDRDGETGDYSRFAFTTNLYGHIANSYSINTKEQLLEEVEKVLNNHLGNISEYTRTETEYGWKFEMYVRWYNDDMEYEVETKDGNWSHHEVFNVEISLYREVYDAFKNLK